MSRTTMDLAWHDRDGVWVGYDSTLPGGCRLYRDADGHWRVTTLVNAAVVDDDPVSADGSDIDALLAAAAVVVDAALYRRSVRLAS